MSDKADQATDTEQLFFNAAMSNKLPTLHFIGQCWSCDEPLNAGIYCNLSCSEDHEKQQRAKMYSQ